MTDKDEIAALKARVEELEARAKPSPPRDLEREAREWADQMHQAREARMSQASAFSREDLRAFEAACSTADLRDIVQHGTIPGPSGAGASGQITKVSNSPGLPGSNTGGWARETPSVLHPASLTPTG
jgi:hypothetical protein